MSLNDMMAGLEPSRQGGLFDGIRKVVPYTPGEQPKGLDRIIKLNTNECPYSPSPRVMEVLAGIDGDLLRRYPSPDNEPLLSALSEYYGLDKKMIFTGVGSDDVLSMCFLTFFNSGRPVLFPDITYSFYDVWADVYRLPYKTLILDDDFRIDPTDYAVSNGGIVIANPNAPTGVSLDLDKIEYIVSHSRDSVVIVDEAYIDFGGESALPLLERHENLIVVRTMSKSRALAGLRVGYAFGNERLIKYLCDVKFSVNSYTLSHPAIRGAVAALEDDEYFKSVIGRIQSTRKAAEEALSSMGFVFNESKANFIFVKHERMDGATLYEALRERGIFVRHFNKERISDYLRITIGTDEEMDSLFSALKEILP